MTPSGMYSAKGQTREMTSSGMYSAKGQSREMTSSEICNPQKENQEKRRQVQLLIPQNAQTKLQKLRFSENCNY